MRAILLPFALIALVLEAMWLVMHGLGGRSGLELGHNVEGTIALLLGISAFYLVSVFLAFKLTGPIPRSALYFIVACGVLFRLTVWPIAPAFSDDVFRYRWEGKLQAAGGNPYQARPNDANWISLRDSTFPYIVGRDFKAAYGPLTELLEAGWYRVVARTVPEPLRQAFWFKLPGAMLELAVSGLLLKLLAVRGLPPIRAITYLWSPLPVFEFWCSGHNDSLMLLPLLMAVILAIRGRWILAYGCLGIAAAAKLWPVILIPLFITHSLRAPSPTIRDPLPSRDRKGAVLQLAAGLALFTAIPIACFLPYRGNIVENLRFMSGFVGGWRNNDLLFGLLLRITSDPDRVKYLSFAILATLVLAIAWMRWPIERSVILTIVALLMVASNCHPWYLAWFLPLLVVEPWSPLLLWTALMPLTYVVLLDWVALGVWNGSTSIRWYVYLPVLAYSIADLLFIRKKLSTWRVQLKSA